MSLWRQLTRGIRALAGRSAADRDITDEVGHYLEEAAADRQAEGLSSEEARRAVRLHAGNAAALEEQIRGSRWEAAIETIGADLRYGARLLRRKPAFTVLGALTLGLGIGASTAIFSAVNPVLFEPLPYPNADRLVTIWDSRDGTRLEVTFGTYREVIQRSRSFESATVFRPLQVTIVGDGDPERLDGQYVSADYFRVLGVSPALGRDFLPSDDRPRTPFVVIISDGLWRRRFAADPGIIGRQITLSDTPVTVIGVMPASFESVLSPSAEIWSALEYDPTLPPNGREWGHNLRLVGRLRPGIDLAQADTELNTIARTPVADFPRQPVAQLSGGFITATLQDDLTRNVRPALVAILGAVLLVLALACVNVTNLLLSSGIERRAEIAVRAALGAARGRLVRQLLVESLLLTVLGGLLGVALAYGAIDAVVAMSPSELPRANVIGVDGPTLAFALGLTTLIGVLIGIVPALQNTNGRPGSHVWHSSARVTHRHHTTRRALVVVQIAFAVVLLVGAGLLVRSLQRLFSVPAGFEAQQLLTLQVQTTGLRYRNAAASHQFFAEALDAVRALPGVIAAAFTSQLPLTGEEDVWGIQFESAPAQAAGAAPDGYRYAVSPGYFEAMGIQLRRGRLLNAGDSVNAPQVAVVSEALARRRLPGLDPIGQRLRIGPSTAFTIVGVVGDVKQTSLALNQRDAVYITNEQWARFSDNARWLVVRTGGDAAAMTSEIRRAVWSVDKNQLVLRVATMEDRLRASAAEQRFALLLFEAFGIVALALAAIGTYSLLSGNVADRTREIGVRTALGATRRSVVSLVLRQGLTLAVLGVVLGVAGALMSSRALVTLLFGISQLDAPTYLAVVTLLIAVSMIACAIPAMRAARVQPSIALRLE
jgi:putative ABC transport system permease protein